MSNGLSGKVCIVTGTGGGIGREAALTFAREGALVVDCGLYVDDAEATLAAVRAAGGTIVSMQPCDLTKPADCQALVDFAVRTFGRIDVLFNNAALAYFNWLEDISDEEWDRNRRSEVDLVFYLTRAAWAYLKASRGLVVNRDWARCLAILGLCLFVTAGLQAQTPDPTPLDAPQPGVRPPLSPFPRFEDWRSLRVLSQRALLLE
jgi:NAD(P)-dependent dehydrogenase (short-subunit alcohol dehydrogenase family)